jgi:DNA-binding HxlR family transcriptional regulator
MRRMSMLEIFKALSNPYRLQIVELLYEKERRPDELESELEMTRGGLERHLKQLVDCGLVEKISFIETGRAKVKYVLSGEAREFYEKARTLVEKFLREKKTPQDRREQLRLLETRLNTLYESIEEVNRLHKDNQITEKEYITVKEGYLRELIEIEKEMSLLLQSVSGE